MTCLVCSGCDLEDVSSAATRAIVRLENAGRSDLAREVRTNETSPTAALIRAGLRKVTKKPEDALAAATGSEATLCHHKDRTWVGITEPILKALDAREGDTIVVRVSMANGSQDELVGVLGSEHRVWLLEHIDIDQAETVTLRRKRRV